MTGRCDEDQLVLEDCPEIRSDGSSVAEIGRFVAERGQAARAAADPDPRADQVHRSR